MNTKKKESLKQRQHRKGYRTRPFVASPEGGYWTENSDRDDFVKTEDTVGKVSFKEESYQRYVVADEGRIREIVKDEIAAIFLSFWSSTITKDHSYDKV